MENKAEIVNNLLCMACLCVGRSIHEVKNEKLKKYYLDTLNEIPLNNIGLVVPIICWECQAMLHKLLAFREQIKDSYRILQTYTENLNECLLSDVSRTPRLKVHKNNPVDIPSDDGIKKDTVKSENNLSYKLEYFDVNNESDDPIQTVLRDVQKSKRKKKSLQKVRKSRIKGRVVPRAASTENGQIMNDSEENSSDKHIDIEIYNCMKNVQDAQNEIKNGNKIENDEKFDVDYVKAELDDKDFNVNTNQDMHSRNNDMQNVLKAEQESQIENQYSSIHNSKNVLEIEMDGVKMELDNKEENTDDNISDTDLRNIDIEIQSFLDNIKKNKKTKSRTNNKTGSKKIITVDLSYDDMQTERCKLAKKESFLKSKYKCDSCIVVFNSATSLKTHQAKKHKVKGDFICSICKTIISSVEAFTAHYKRHMRRYECPNCGKRMTDMKAMHRHIFTKHEVTIKKYACDVCGKISNSLDAHRYHRDTHKARVECSQCDKTFSHRAGLMNHRLAVHESQNEFPCTVCKKVFRWKTSLKRHFEKHTAENKGDEEQNKAFCSSCNIAFSSVCSLQRHLRNSLKHVTHDQLKFICDHCEHRFADKTKLRDHIEEKHLHRTFKCPICNKSSKNRVGLEQHIRAVHKGRPNNRMCHHCGKGFPTKVQLDSHIRTHTGERPFMCEFCPTTFSQQSNLYKHHRQVHLNMKTKRYLCKKRKLVGNQSGDPQFALPIIQYIPDSEFILGTI